MGFMNVLAYGHWQPESLPARDKRRLECVAAMLATDRGAVKKSYREPVEYRGYVVWQAKIYPPEVDREKLKAEKEALREREKIQRERVRRQVRAEGLLDGFVFSDKEKGASDDSKIRPANWEEYIGQKQAVELVRQMVEACARGGNCLRHLLFFGPAGVGKTALTAVIANELDTDTIVVNAKTLRDTAGLLNLFSKVRPVSAGQGTIIQVDEIDLLDMDVAKQLHRVLEEGKLDFQSPAGDFLQAGIFPFTMIGTTNNLGKMDSAFVSRMYEINFQDYSSGEIGLILAGISAKLGFPLEASASENLSRRCRGNPRQAVLAFQLVRDVAKNRNKNGAGVAEVEEAMRLLGVDGNGFSRLDLKALEYLRGMPERRASEKSLADCCGLDVKTYCEKVEAYLKKTGMILVTGRGRVLTQKGMEYVKITGRGRA